MAIEIVRFPMKNGALMGVNGVLMGFNGVLMDIWWDLMGYMMEVASGKHRKSYWKLP